MNILIAGQRDKTENYEKALDFLGACPITWLPDASDCFFCPSGKRRALNPEILSRFDGLLLPGGGDIHPEFFHQENEGSYPPDILLDCQQIALFFAFQEAGKPVLGICKGMQIINTALGGSLCQDLPEPCRSAHAWSSTEQYHETRILPDTFLHRIYGTSLLTNSAHHQAVSRLGEGLLPAQYGPEQVLEALFHASLPVLGVQWHPERMMAAPRQKKDPKTGDGSQVLRYFLSLCQLNP